MPKASLHVKAECVELMTIANLGLLYARKTVLYEHVLDEQMSVLLDRVGVDCQQSDALPRDLG